MGISGKSGFEEWVEIHGVDWFLKNCKVYASDNQLVPLSIKSEADLVVYYTYGISIATGKEVHLQSESYIDIEEREMIENKLQLLKRYYRKCKRKKIAFDKEEALKIIKLFDRETQDYELELVNRVADLGDKATGDDIHDPSHDRMRAEWYRLMVEKGWNEDVAYRWVYGWRRWFERQMRD